MARIMKSESILESISVEKITAISDASGGCTEKPSRGVPAASDPQCHQPLKTMADRDYARKMEERYGILNEGAF